MPGRRVSRAEIDRLIAAAHELGHNLGLGHIDDISNLMNPVLMGGTQLSAAQMATLGASPLVQNDFLGDFVSITPILITPEPEALALVLGAVGIYGVVSYGVGQRTREIGVKLAVGARKGHIMAQFIFEALLISLIGGLAGMSFSVLVVLLVVLRLGISLAIPVIINAKLRDGSLRQTANEMGITTLLYEAGEALRFDEVAIRAGMRGIVSVMQALEMLNPQKGPVSEFEPLIVDTSSWVRAPASGIRTRASTGPVHTHSRG